MKNCAALGAVVVLSIMVLAGSLDARVTLLPDYINDNPFEDRINERTAQKYQVLCENYAGVTAAYAQSHGLVCKSVFSPMPNLTCYRDCGCDVAYRYSTANCPSQEGKKLAGSTCNGLYNACNCDTTIYKYRENDPSCATKKFSGICKGSNGTFYRSCDDPCDGLTEANCVVDGVDLGCAETYGNGCDLCKSCNNNTCNLPENINKPVIATECNGCDVPVPGCPSKCESGCGQCEANCSGYRFDSPSAIPFVNETYDCVLCGGTTKYKAKSCVSGYKIDPNTGGCTAMTCDEYLAAEGYALVSSKAEFEMAISQNKPIVLRSDINASDTYTLKQNIYDYAKMYELGYTQCPKSSARLTFNSLTTNKSGGTVEIYPEISFSSLAVAGNTQLYGGTAGSPLSISFTNSATLSLLGAETYAGGRRLSGTGSITVGPASLLTLPSSSFSIKGLRLQIGGCAEQGNFLVCGGTSEASITFHNSGASLPTRCETGGWTNGRLTCSGNIYTNCSVGSTPVDLRYDGDRDSICPLMVNTLVALPVQASGAQENYKLLSSLSSGNYNIYCTRCQPIDECDKVATTCYRAAEAQFANCFSVNSNPSYCMGTEVRTAKEACDQARELCRGPENCAVQWSKGKDATAVVSNFADLKAAVLQDNIEVIVVDGDISLSESITLPDKKQIIGATSSVVGCSCDEYLGSCATGKYRLLVNGDATNSSEGTQKLIVQGGATLRDIAVFTNFQEALNSDVAAVYVNTDSEVKLNNIYIEGNEGYGIKDISAGGANIKVSGDSVINGTVALRGKDMSAAGTGTELIIDQDASVVVGGYDKGIEKIENLKMVSGSGVYTKLRVNANTLGISLYKTDGSLVPNAYVDLALNSGQAIVFEELSGVTPVWPFNTKIRITGNGTGLYSKGNRILTISGDFDWANSAATADTKGIVSEGSLTISNGGSAGEGVVRLAASTVNPLIDVKNVFEAESYLSAENQSPQGTAIRAAHATFNEAKCYIPAGSSSCEGFFANSADISANTGIEIVSGSSSVYGQLIFKKGANVNFFNDNLTAPTAILLNGNTGMTLEKGSAVTVSGDKAVVSAASDVSSTVNGDFEANVKTSAFSGGTQSVGGVLTVSGGQAFAEGSSASFNGGSALQFYPEVSVVADNTSKLKMPANALFSVSYATDEETGTNRNNLFTQGLYDFAGTQLMSEYDGADTSATYLYALTTKCASTEDVCSMSSFKLEDFINSLGAGSGTETDAKGNSLAKLSSCSSTLFGASSCTAATGNRAIYCPYDSAKMLCYGVIRSNSSGSEIFGRELPLSYFE